jgi:sulfur carrier protein ThiS
MRFSVLVLLLIAAITVSACGGPAMMPAKSAETDGGETFLVALPRIVMAADENGNLNPEGLPLSTLVPGVQLPSVGAPLVQQMQAANVQHIELRHTGDGLVLLVNGMPMPSISWDDDSLKATGDLLAVFGPGLGLQGEALQQLVTQLAPIVQRMGISVAVKFPAVEGAPVVEFAPDDVALAPVAAAEAAPSAIAKFEVKYDEQGVPSIMGVSARDIARLTGQSNLALALDPGVIASAQANNLQTLQLTTAADGLTVSLNGQTLPKIAWDEGRVGNVIDLLTQLNPALAPSAPIIKRLAPMLTNTNVGIMLHFPLAAGAEPIQVKMQ